MPKHGGFIHRPKPQQILVKCVQFASRNGTGSNNALVRHSTIPAVSILQCNGTAIIRVDRGNRGAVKTLTTPPSAVSGDLLLALLTEEADTSRILSLGPAGASRVKPANRTNEVPIGSQGDAPTGRLGLLVQPSG